MGRHGTGGGNVAGRGDNDHGRQPDKGLCAWRRGVDMGPCLRLMDPRQITADERNTGFCVFCGCAPSTRDHVPSRVFLDEPYPSDLAVVPACEACNNGFSKDEQYVACLVDCALRGTVEPGLKRRDKVERILRENPRLATLISKGKHVEGAGRIIWEPDKRRVMNVVLKLARGHAAYELSEPRLDEPEHVFFVPLCVMTREQLEQFESPGPMMAGWPELGSRAFLRAASCSPAGTQAGWIELQAGRYRYLVTELNGLVVRAVLSEYLACEVVWT